MNFSQTSPDPAQGSREVAGGITGMLQRDAFGGVPWAKGIAAACVYGCGSVAMSVGACESGLQEQALPSASKRKHVCPGVGKRGELSCAGAVAQLSHASAL